MVYVYFLSGFLRMRSGFLDLCFVDGGGETLKLSDLLKVIQLAAC